VVTFSLVFLESYDILSRGTYGRQAVASARMADADFNRYCASFGRGIKRLRLSQKLTQEDMMERGFSLRHYQRIEAGRSITLRTLLKLARAFRVQPRDLLPPAGSARGG